MCQGLSRSRRKPIEQIPGEAALPLGWLEAGDVALWATRHLRPRLVVPRPPSRRSEAAGDAQTSTRKPRELAWLSGKSGLLAVSRGRAKWPLTCGFAAPPAGLEPATRCLEGSRSIR